MSAGGDWVDGGDWAEGGGWADAGSGPGLGWRPVVEGTSVSDSVPNLRNPIALAAFEGWNDAGDAASGVIAHLKSVWDVEPLAALDPEEYHDFQVNRPTVSIHNGRRRITWPTTRLYWARPEGSERDVILVQGIEPSTRWRR